MENLIFAVKNHIIEMDKIMQEPSTYERGRKIARFINILSNAVDKAEKAKDNQ